MTRVESDEDEGFAHGEISKPPLSKTFGQKLLRLLLISHLDFWIFGAGE